MICLLRKILLLILVAALPIQGVTAATNVPCALKHLGASKTINPKFSVGTATVVKQKHSSLARAAAFDFTHSMVVPENESATRHQKTKKEKCDSCVLHCHVNAALLAFPAVLASDNTLEVAAVSPASSLSTRQPARLERPPKHQIA